MSDSSQHSTIHSLGMETRRRRNRLERMGRSTTPLEGKVIDGGVSPMITNGVLKVPTMRESLMQGTSAEVRRKRRQLNRRMNHLLVSRNTLSSSTSTTASTSLTSDCDYSVSFNNVQVREYMLLPGDNPTVSDGPPLTYSWVHEDEHFYPIDDFEDFRECDRRLPFQMRVPRAVRYQLLLDHGNTHSEIQKATKEANILRSQRHKTYYESEKQNSNGSFLNLPGFKSKSKSNRKDKIDKTYLALLNRYSEEAEKSFEKKLREISAFSKASEIDRTLHSPSIESLSPSPSSEAITQNPSIRSHSSTIERSLKSPGMASLLPNSSRERNLKSSSLDSMENELDQSNKTQDTTRTNETDATERFERPTIDTETYSRLMDDLFRISPVNEEETERHVQFARENSFDVSIQSNEISDDCCRTCYLIIPPFVQQAGAKFEPTPVQVEI